MRYRLGSRSLTSPTLKISGFPLTVNEKNPIINRSEKRFDITQFSNDTATEFGTTVAALTNHETDTPIIWKKNTALGKDNPFVLDDLIADTSDRREAK